MSSVARSLEILEALADSRTRPNHTELATRLHIPKSTLSQLLSQLVGLGFARMVDGTYAPGPRLVALGYRATQMRGLSERLKPIMDALASESGETVILGVPIGDAVVYVEQTASKNPIRYVADVGAIRPLHCTAMGKVLLSFSERSAQIQEQLELSRLTDNTIVDADALATELAQIRQRGYATNCGESVDGVIAVAAPVFASDRTPLAAISITGPVGRLEGQTERLWKLLKAKIADLDGAIGGPDPSHPAPM